MVGGPMAFAGGGRPAGICQGPSSSAVPSPDPKPAPKLPTIRRGWMVTNFPIDSHVVDTPLPILRPQARASRLHRETETRRVGGEERDGKGGGHDRLHCRSGSADPGVRYQGITYI
ncbi:hypothetical protein Naga_100832g1 [Nannochloropsis gaditana]|uniref:Uncharacterized protein n=1 Tax=Nannochloropsis gaditana TaxID=72520 RepID=W7TVR4_9STRA|nr:hypothetical protein Naga_100832g1 [Nannochloropsis gaditana]